MVLWDISQGAPPSSSIGALAINRLIRRLEGLARDHETVVAQYVNDPTLSRPAHVGRMQHCCGRIIRDEDFGVSIEKVDVMPSSKEQVATRVRMNRQLDVTRKTLREIGREMGLLEAGGRSVKVTSWEGELRLGHPAQGTRQDMLLHVAADRWLAFKQEDGLDEKSQRIYRDTLRQFIWFANRHRVRHLRRVSADLLEAYQRELADPGLPISAGFSAPLHTRDTHPAAPRPCAFSGNSPLRRRKRLPDVVLLCRRHAPAPAVGWGRL